MSLKTRTQKQTCVYWAPGNTESGGKAFDENGVPQYASPVEKICRWDETSEIFVSTNGVEEVSKAIVFVDDIAVGGVLMLGTLDDVTDEDVPQNNEGAWEIRKRERVPNVRGTIFYEWAYL